MRGLKQQKNTGSIPLEAKTRCAPSRLLTGFTLLEMIVAIGVFMVVITISLTAFLNVHDIQLKMSAFRAASDSINFTVEIMVRDTEEGRCTLPDSPMSNLCNDGNFSLISFYKLNEAGDDYNKVSYECVDCASGGNNGSIRRSEVPKSDPYDWSVLTPNNVDITYLNFGVTN
ncbi:MAG: type II secretion system protein, partial [Patescibacteria group bacterium]